jgi:hypothetical protein
MRHFSRTTLISAVCAFLVTAAPAYADEVSDFTVNATVAATGDLNIEEKILVDFGNNKKHGLLRKIPTYFASDNAELDLISAECPPGKACPKVISQLHQSLQLKLGEPKVLISGKHTYRLKYVIKNPATTAGNTLSYEWSPNGKNWQMPIKTMTVNLKGISPAVCKSLVTVKEDGLPGATIYGTSGNYKVSAHDLQPGQVVLLKISLSAPSGQILSSSTTANKKTGILQSLTSLDHNVQVGLWIVVIVGFALVLAALVKSQSNCSCRCGPVCSCMCGCRKGCTCQSTSFKEEPVTARRSVFGSGYNSYGNNDNYNNYNDNYDSWSSNSSSSSSSWSSSDSSSSSSDSGGSGDGGGGDSW